MCIFAKPLIAKVGLVVNLHIEIPPQLQGEALHDIAKGIRQGSVVAVVGVVTLITVLFVQVGRKWEKVRVVSESKK